MYYMYTSNSQYSSSHEIHISVNFSCSISQQNSHNYDHTHTRQEREYVPKYAREKVTMEAMSLPGWTTQSQIQQM